MYPSFPTDPFNDPYMKLQNIQIEIAIHENALDELRRKPSLSAEDHWSIVNRRNELQRLRDLEIETNFFLMDPRPVPKNWSNVKEPVVDEVENLANIVNRRYSSPLTDRKPNVPQAFPMAMEVDRKPFIKPEPPAAPRLSFPASSSIPTANQSRKPFIKPEPPAAPRLSLPASSSIPTANQPRFLPPPALERKPLVTPPKQPVASGSKGPPPPFPKYEPFLPSDDLDMNPSDSENEDYLPNMNPTIADDLVNRIGITIPPPIENDAQDDNGDYYGRGRDLFEGPRASADECVYAHYFNSAMDFLTILP
jgi:hypothetical protein